MYLLLFDGFNSYKESFNELIHTEKYKSVS
jgi:t-SNARE complex subunit (syntaxin)